ncbi:hypothetical protein BH10ACI2_BH10ACI2_00990 [soil metagenome]
MNTASQDRVIVRLSPVATNVISLLFALVIVVGMFPLPRPAAVSNQPWKVEFLAAILILAGAFWMLRNGRLNSVGFSRFRGKWVYIPTGCLFAFILWSGTSFIWANSSGAVVHHTLTWSIYLSVVLLAVLYFQISGSFDIFYKTFALAAIFLGINCLIDFVSITDFASQEGPIRIRYGKYAELLVTITPFLFAWALFQRRKLALAATVYIWLLGWVTVMLSLSKGAFLSGVIGHLIALLGCVLFSKKRIRQRSLTFASIWLALTILVQVAVPWLTAIPSTSEYVGGSADHDRSSTAMRLMTWKISLTIAADYWFRGIGADNFGISFNDARAEYATSHPTTGPIEVAEDYIVERTHNEYLQIFTELGLVGFLLFAATFGAFKIAVLCQMWINRFRLPPLLWASIGGMIAFATSSAVSSFSFRVAQTGIAFFIVFAIGLNAIAKLNFAKPQSKTSNPSWFQPLLLFCCICAILTFIYGCSKAVSEYYVYQAEHTEDLETAEKLYRTSFAFDADNAAAHYYLSSRFAAEKQYGNAAKEQQIAIDRGLGVSLTYSLLAKYQLLIGDPASAETTLKKSLTIYPNSVFLHVRYAVFLEDHGRQAEAATQMEIAKKTDSRQASGWYSIIKDGSVATFYKSQTDKTMATPVELLPENAKYEYIDDPNSARPGNASDSGQN